MFRVVYILWGLVCAFSAHSMSNQELIENLSSRLINLPDSSGSIIKSFTTHSQSYIYDQALAVIAFTKDNDQAKARKLLQGLSTLQMKDGSLYFSYNLDGTSPYPAEGDKRIAGAMAWVALAAVHYQSKFKSREFLRFNYQLLSYLASEIREIEIKGIKSRALRFAPNDVSSTPFPEDEVVALEHNLDAYAAFLQFATLNKHEKWKKEASHLRTFILSMWDSSKSHFWSGANLKTKVINKTELYLDNQTWSLLALDEKTLKKLAPDQALDLNCEVFFVNHNGIKGFMDSKPARGPASHSFVWSEGTLGQILAMRKLRKMKNETIYCNDHTSTDILTSVKQMKNSDGGIAYATSSENKDFTTASSVAGTAWMYFVSSDFNPFELESIN
jgi:hypothetical protein